MCKSDFQNTKLSSLHGRQIIKKHELLRLCFLIFKMAASDSVSLSWNKYFFIKRKEELKCIVRESRKQEKGGTNELIIFNQLMYHSCHQRLMDIKDFYTDMPDSVGFVDHNPTSSGFLSHPHALSLLTSLSALLFRERETHTQGNPLKTLTAYTGSCF